MIVLGGQKFEKKAKVMVGESEIVVTSKIKERLAFLSNFSPGGEGIRDRSPRSTFTSFQSPLALGPRASHSSSSELIVGTHSAHPRRNDPRRPVL
jgi:hypothetical protein